MKHLKEELKPAYLGDGLYAYTDGYQIWLTCERDGMQHEVALEQPVFKSLIDYARSIEFFGVGS